MSSTAILVLGMHRSGTSAMTRVLNLLGVELGQDLMSAKPDNITGFWEKNDIVNMNESLLVHLGQCWSDVREFVPGWLESRHATHFSESLVNVLETEFGGSSLWGLKDPRVCRLLPLYKPVLSTLKCHVKAIIVMRNPLQVARSLQERNGFSIEYGLLLWIRYVVEAERFSRDVDRVFVEYEELLSDWRLLIAQVTETLQIDWPIAEPDAASSIDSFLDPSLQHHKTDTTLPGKSAPMASLALAMYRLLQSAGDGSGLQDAMDDFAGTCFRLTSLFGNGYSTIESFLPLFQGDVSSIANMVLSVERTMAVLALEKKQDEFAAFSSVQEVELSRFKREKRQAIEEKRQAIEEKQQAVEEKRQAIEEKRQVVEEMRCVREQVVELQRWLEYVRGTISWQITRPLRVGTRACRHGISAFFSVDRRKVSLALFMLKQHGVRYLAREAVRRLRPLPNPVTDRPVYPESVQEFTDLEPIRLPCSERPDISIIIPVYNKFEYTFACLRSIVKETAGAYEVIVVDDGSSDLTLDIGSYVKGINLVRNSENLGFVGSCNAGAEKARGEYLLFLNNDTIVQSGWLDALRDAFGQYPDAGLVGAKLIYPDGRLQEAGGIIWQDASGWNYGHLNDPDRPEFNYLREVDYCSGACILVPNALYKEIGGFDERYAPAYYEDTDLAFAVRAAGRKVIYQPFAEVIHYEGVTSGTDLSAGAKKYQLANQEKFYEKWKDVLKYHLPPGSDPVVAADRMYAKRVLVIDSYTPMPDRDAGSLRMFHILQILLRTGFKVTFAAENLGYHPQYSPAVRKIGVETLCRPYISKMSTYLHEKGSLFDVVIISRRDVAEMYMQDIIHYCPNARIVFDTVDLHFVREAREKLVDAGKNIESCHYSGNVKEIVLAGQADVVWVVSEAEKKLLEDIAPNLNVDVVSLVHDVQPTERPFPERNGILFVGSFMHPPNIDAINFYFEQVHMKVREKIGPVAFYVVGANPPKGLQRWEKKFPEVHLTGYVEDIRPFFDKVRLSVAPLRYGAGVKGKINSSMSLGVPVVTTSIGAEGMRLCHGVNAMIADDPDSLTQAIVDVHENPVLWHDLVQNGFDNIREYFSFDRAEYALKNSLQGAGTHRESQ